VIYRQFFKKYPVSILAR